MHYGWYVFSAYFALGLFLTRYVLAAPSIRLRFKDFVLGGLFMPLVILAMLACVLWEELWKRIVVMLDLDPPEEMRAGPKEPTSPDSKDA